MMDEELSFSELLKSLRKKKRLKIADMVRLLGVSERTYKGWEMGERLPPQTYLKLIAKTLQLHETDEDTFYRAAGHIPPDIKHLPPRNDFFTGRETQLRQIGELLKENTTVAITQPVSISGLGGIGKTQLALEYAYRQYKDKTYRAVLWVDAADKEMIESSYLALADRLGLPERKDQDTKIIVEAVKEWLQEHTGWLLIIDNADDLYLARSFFPAGGRGHILLTTRTQIVGIVAKQIELEEMMPEEGLLFLLKRAKVLENEAALETVPAAIRAAAQQLVELLGWHPLALDQAGAYVEETTVSFAEYIKLYKEKRQALLKRRDASNSSYGDHPESVAATFELSLEKASKLHQLAVSIIVCLCALLQPDAIPEEFFQYIDTFDSDPTAFSEGIAALRRYSLIKRNAEEKTLSMHRLVQAVVLHMMTPEVKKHWHIQIVRLLYQVLPYKEPHRYLEDLGEDEDEESTNYWNTVQAQLKNVIYPGPHPAAWLLPHILACLSWIDPALVPSEDVSRFLNKAAIYLDRMARASEAELLLARALAIQEHDSGPQHINNAVSLYSLAEIYYIDHRYSDKDPESLYRRAIAIFVEYLTPWHPFIDYACEELKGVLLHKGVPDHHGLRHELMFAAEDGKIAEGLPPLIDQGLRTHLVDLLRKAGHAADADALEANGKPKPPKQTTT